MPRNPATVNDGEPTVWTTVLAVVTGVVGLLMSVLVCWVAYIIPSLKTPLPHQQSPSITRSRIQSVAYSVAASSVVTIKASSDGSSSRRSTDTASTGTDASASTRSSVSSASSENSTSIRGTAVTVSDVGSPQLVNPNSTPKPKPKRSPHKKRVSFCSDASSRVTSLISSVTPSRNQEPPAASAPGTPRSSIGSNCTPFFSDAASVGSSSRYSLDDASSSGSAAALAKKIPIPSAIVPAKVKKWRTETSTEGGGMAESPLRITQSPSGSSGGSGGGKLFGVSVSLPKPLKMGGSKSRSKTAGEGSRFSAVGREGEGEGEDEMKTPVPGGSRFEADSMEPDSKKEDTIIAGSSSSPSSSASAGPGEVFFQGFVNPFTAKKTDTLASSDAQVVSPQRRFSNTTPADARSVPSHKRSSTSPSPSLSPSSRFRARRTSVAGAISRSFSAASNATVTSASVSASNPSPSASSTSIPARSSTDRKRVKSESATAPLTPQSTSAAAAVESPKSSTSLGKKSKTLMTNLKSKGKEVVVVASSGAFGRSRSGTVKRWEREGTSEAS